MRAADPKAAPLVLLSDVSFWYPSDSDGRDVLRGLSLSVSRGDVVSVRGRNGTGKTTLLKVLGGLLQPTRGCARVEPGMRALYLDQNAADFVAPALTVKEQLLVGIGERLKPFDRGYREGILGQLHDLLDPYALGLAGRLDSFTAQLSGGQRQVIALLCGLLADTDLLLLDEYASYMDKTTLAVSSKLLADVVNSGRVAAVIVDHTGTLASICNREIDLDCTS